MHKTKVYSSLRDRPGGKRGGGKGGAGCRAFFLLKRGGEGISSSVVPQYHKAEHPLPGRNTVVAAQIQRDIYICARNNVRYYRLSRWPTYILHRQLQYIPSPPNPRCSRSSPFLVGSGLRSVRKFGAGSSQKSPALATQAKRDCPPPQFLKIIFSPYTEMNCPMQV